MIATCLLTTRLLSLASPSGKLGLAVDEEIKEPMLSQAIDTILYSHSMHSYPRVTGEMVTSVLHG